MMIEWPLSAKQKLKQRIDGLLGRNGRYSFQQLAGFGLIERPHYAYCVYHAAELAAALGIPRISVIEFGVAGGNGLVALERIVELIRTRSDLPTEIEIYGFDTGGGMPEVEGDADLPYWFAAGQYKMDEDALRRRLKRSNLVLGNVRDTVPAFLAAGEHAAIGAMMIDVDYYSSTNDCLRLLEAEDVGQHCLPRVHMYLDDIIGGSIEMYGPANGMLKSVEEFNARHDDRAIHINQNLRPKSHLSWRYQIYYAHLFGHPQYRTYVGGSAQDRMQAGLKLRGGA